MFFDVSVTFSRIYRFLNIFSSLLILFFSSILVIQAQSNFSAEAFHHTIESQTPFSKFHLPQENFHTPDANNRKQFVNADDDIDPTFNASVTEGEGYVKKTVVQTDGKIVVVGSFQRANGTRAYDITRLNADGTLDASFNTGTGVTETTIETVALQPDGKIVIGGGFTTFNGRTVNGIARLNSDGSFDSTFDTNSSITIYFLSDILILPNGKILISGNFGGFSSGLVRLNSNGTLDTIISSFNDSVNTIALAPDGKIVVGGRFSQPRANVARFNADDSLDTSFNQITGSNGYSVNKVIVQPNGKILAAGVFRNFNEVETDGLVRLNDNGTIDKTFKITFEPFLYLEVASLALQPDGKILIGYDYINNGLRYSIDVRRFNADATIDTSFNTNTDNTLFAYDLNVLSDGSILVGGTFPTVNNQQHLRLVKLNSNGSLVNNFNPAISSVGIIYAIKKQTDGKTIIVGNFSYVNGVVKNLIARLNPDGSLDNSFNPSAGLFGTIYDVVIQTDGKIIIGGIFGGTELFPAMSLARLNSDGSFDTNLNTNDYRVNSAYALALQADGKILVGGQLNSQTGSGSPPILRLNPDGSLDGNFNPPIVSNVTIRDILVQPNGKIIIGGSFYSRPNFQRQNIAELNADGTLDTGFVSDTQQDVFTLARQTDGKIYAGGVKLSRYTSQGTLDSTFNVGSGFNGLIYNLETQSNGEVLVGGYINAFNGTPISNIVRLNNNGLIDSTFNASASGTVYAFKTQTDGKILVGGRFLDFNNVEKFSIVRLQNSALPRKTPFDFDGDNRTDVGIFRPAVGQWWYRRSSDGQVPVVSFGSSTDKIVAADFTGDGRTDIAVFRPSTGLWFILRSEDSSFYSFPFGSNGDIPTPADFDGDGKADPAVFRPSTSTWYIQNSGGGTTITNFGTSGDLPVAADYDGDNRADIGIFRPSSGQWWINRSTAGLTVATFGTSTDRTVQADYTGDGKTDIAVWRPSTGQWFVLRSEDSAFYAAPFGASGDSPTPGDYDGDGRSDFAVFRPSNNTWYLQQSTGGFTALIFGTTNDMPVPSAYVR